MNHQRLPLGILIILLGFAFVVIGSLTGPQKSDTKVAVGDFIGFIPFGFANDKKLFPILLFLMAVFLVFLIYLRLVS